MKKAYEAVKAVWESATLREKAEMVVFPILCIAFIAMALR